ncbi:response regulator transcription factor [Plectonema cf. radiosum LEGE 06105]|uniref:Response regulator transcription factor n=1 Tax=Plectonema cf. radiosum LEGE 06105 TaxID=945769 RepID=A0A8J7JU36_9CYAN|nr:response regulator transcription factor [Plectonema radiosum]MBE9214574.1 response regulator transcription factor [Plectonema cf. radiosum LEGE 06105]
MKKILVIENQVTLRNFFLKFLNDRGFDAIGAENGSMGVKLAKEHSPLLVICNVKALELNYHSIITDFRQNAATKITPFIFIATETIDRQLLTENKLLSNSYDTYLTQPYQEEELLLTINVQLQKRIIIQQWCVSREFCQQNQTSEAINTFKSESSLLRRATAEPATTGVPQSIFPISNCSLLNKVFQFIEENYHQQINLGDVAEAVGYTATYLTNLVKRQTQKGIYGWIIERRMAEARCLLIKTDQSVSWIAAKVGYPDSGHFSRLFRQNYSISPKAWRDTYSENILVEETFHGTSRMLLTKS